MTDYRVLVTGGRDFNDVSLMESAFLPIIRACSARHLRLVLIHGAARGADLMAAAYCSAAGAECRAFPAKWDEHGRGAGHIRNQQMLDEGHPHVCVAFPGGRGTANMIERCQRVGVLVIEAANAKDVYR